jgi:Sec-independent protein secretion pathway component TatC
MKAQDNEPTLESIDDYNTLKGSKKRVVWSVILIGIVIGLIFTVAKSYYNNVNDSLPVKESIGKVPVK